MGKREKLRKEFGKVLVRTAIQKDGWAADAIWDIAAEDRIEWTPDDWNRVICDLDNCQLRISDWLGDK